VQCDFVFRPRNALNFHYSSKTSNESEVCSWSDLMQLFYRSQCFKLITMTQFVSLRSFFSRCCSPCPGIINSCRLPFQSGTLVLAYPRKMKNSIIKIQFDSILPSIFSPAGLISEKRVEEEFKLQFVFKWHSSLLATPPLAGNDKS
jgi:hypothetical protein